MGTIRELTAHKVNGLNEALRIFVLDEPGSGGACHEYAVLVPMSEEVQKITHPENVNWDHDRIERRQWTDGSNFKPYTLLINGVTAAIVQDEKVTYFICQYISFQNGPVKEKGYNGNSHEALLAILLDRMESFQAGPYACHDNQMALDHLQGARLWLHKRTMDRVARQVEGTHQK